MGSRFAANPSYETMLGDIIGYVAFASFIGVAIYSFVATLYLSYDLSFPPSARLKWKRVPRPMMYLGIISGVTILVCMTIGAAAAMLEW